MIKKLNKILVFDLDGTLLNSKKQILESSRIWIEKAKQQHFLIIFCSGRSLIDIIEYQKKYNIVDYIVANNGSYWYKTKTQETKIINYLDSDTAKTILDKLKRFDPLVVVNGINRIIHFKYSNETMVDNFYKTVIDKEKNFFNRDYSFTHQHALDFIENNKTLQIGALFKKYSFDEVVNDFKELDNINIFYSASKYIDINARGVSKYNGIKELCKDQNLNFDNIYFFGDSGNDHELLEKAKYSYAMDNADILTKQKAKYVIGDHDNDSIAKTIEKILEENNVRNN
ncbi:MAG: Cof-type HAD-IIB family hydrolase [Mycoplasma sp.]|nr:Cof-type HAD-IIB family hydrolase [Mycoplasma sp.]